MLDPSLVPTSSPFGSTGPSDVCGDSICSTNEDSDTCSADCAERELTTTFNFSLGSEGNIFEVVALRDLSVSSLVINAMTQGQGAVKVYSRDGSYSGHEQNSEGWELIYDNPSVTHMKRGQATELGNFETAVLINSGATQSFFVSSSRGLVYRAGTHEGVAFASDESIIVKEGIGTTGEFDGSTTYSPRIFGGIIR